MNEPSPRIAAGLLGLVALWIGVYWWWPSSSQPQGITFSEGIAQPSETARPTRSSAPLIPAAPIQASDPLGPAAMPPPTPENTEQKPFGSDPVIAPKFREHTVAPGETYAAISLKYFGTSAYASAIGRANPLMSPTSLRPGRVIKVPQDPKNLQGVPVRQSTKPGGSLSTEYIVEPGDTLSRIAQKFYGDSSLASTIYNANRSILADEDSLRVGQKLMLPPKPQPQ